MRRHTANRFAELPALYGPAQAGTDGRHVARTAVVVGGCIGSATGVVGAVISDPEVGFPAWVDLTGIVAGFALGALVTGLVLLGLAMWSRQSKQHGRT